MQRIFMAIGALLLLTGALNAEVIKADILDRAMIDGIPLGGKFTDIADYKNELWAYQSSDLFLKTDWNKIDFYKMYQEERLPFPPEDGAYSQFIAVTPKMMTRSKQVYVDQGRINQASFFDEFSSFSYVVADLEKALGDKALRYDYDRGTTIFCIKDDPILRDIRIFRMEISGVSRHFYAKDNQRVADVCPELFEGEF